MSVYYNGLWKLLIDKNMKKVDLINELKISSSTVAKMTKGENVSMNIMEKICDELDCDFGDTSILSIMRRTGLVKAMEYKICYSKVGKQICWKRYSRRR